MLRTILLIGSGSFIGGIARYLLGVLMPHSTNTNFPIATLIINVLGCFLIGMLNGLFQKGHLLPGDLWMFLTVGFCGGFTTFSTYIFESYSLFNNEQFLHFALYASLSFTLGLFAAYGGYQSIRLLP